MCRLRCLLSTERDHDAYCFTEMRAPVPTGNPSSRPYQLKPVHTAIIKVWILSFVFENCYRLMSWCPRRISHIVFCTLRIFVEFTESWLLKRISQKASPCFDDVPWSPSETLLPVPLTSFRLIFVQFDWFTRGSTFLWTISFLIVLFDSFLVVRLRFSCSGFVYM